MLQRIGPASRIAFALLVAACSATEGGFARDSEVEGDGMCGDLQCSNGLRISLVAEGGVFTGGRYEVHTSADGTGRVCSFRIGAEPEQCFGDPPCVLEDECELVFNFSAVPHSVALVVGPDPDVVDVGIVRDGQTVGGQTLAPQYDDYAPNGDDCPPVCQVASGQVSVS